MSVVSLPAGPGLGRRGWHPGRWTSGLMLLAALAGCAGVPGSDGDVAASAEPLTESDEPETRTRARLRVELATGYFEQDKPTIALDEIKQALAADPRYAPAYVLRGLVYMRLNDDRLADESFRRALQLSPRDPDALHNYGWFQCLQGRRERAIELFERALASPTYGGRAKTLMAKGVCEVQLGRLAEAERSFARSYELDAGNPVTAYNLAKLLYQRGDHERAQFYARRLNQSELANAESLWLGIAIERRLGQAQAVEQLGEQLVRRFPDSREVDAFRRGVFHD
jgi:type IV pilus assembly protein PilF